MDEDIDEEFFDFDPNFFEFDPLESHYAIPFPEQYPYGYAYGYVRYLFITGLLTTSAVGPGRIWTGDTTTQLGSVSLAAAPQRINGSDEWTEGYFRGNYGQTYHASEACCESCTKEFPSTIMFNYEKESSGCQCLKTTPEKTPATKAPYTLGKCQYRTSPGEFCIENGVFLGKGPFLKQIATSGQEECSSACSSTEGCTAWTLRLQNNYCWLMSEDSIKGNDEGWVTGTRDCGLNRGTPLGLIVSESVDMKGEAAGVVNSEGCCEECEKVHNGTELFAYIDTDVDSSNTLKMLHDQSCMCYTKKHGVKPVTLPSNFYAGVCGTSYRTSYGELRETARNCKTTAPRPDKNGDLSKGNQACIFPFRFFGVIYYTCAPGNATSGMPEDSFWCSTEVDYFGEHVKDQWGYCGEGCT